MFSELNKQNKKIDKRKNVVITNHENIFFYSRTHMWGLTIDFP